MSMSDLPSRGQLEDAISQWWSGGGSTLKIVDVLRKESATVSEARALAERLAVRAQTNHYLDANVIDEQLEMVRASFAVREQRGDIIQKHTKARASAKYPGLAWDDKRGWVWAGGVSSAPDYDPDLCVYADGVRCWQCSKIYGEPIVHGHLLSPEELAARMVEIRALLAARAEEVKT